MEEAGHLESNALATRRHHAQRTSRRTMVPPVRLAVEVAAKALNLISE